MFRYLLVTVLKKTSEPKNIEQSQLAQIRKNLDDEYRIVETATYERLQRAYGW